MPFAQELRYSGLAEWTSAHVAAESGVLLLSAISCNYAARRQCARTHQDYRNVGTRRLADRPVRHSFTRT